MIDNYIFQPKVDEKENIIATYYLEGKEMVDVAKSVAIGQSIGNPNVRTHRDSPEMMRNNLAKIVDEERNLYGRKKGIVKIAYPLENLDLEEDGITQLLCTLMGGQMDIDSIKKCYLKNIQFPQKYLKNYKGPKFGMDNIIKRAGAIGRPLLGAIVKPKTGIDIPQLKELIYELLKGGVDFIKEDEILGNPAFCKFKERVPIISDLVNNFAEKQGREIFYTPCINSDYPYFLDRAEFASEHGIKAVHLNIWAGLPAYRALRDLDLSSAIFFQKSGDKVMTGSENKYHVEWSVICELARMSGADFIHAGMWGGYLSTPKKDMDDIMNILREQNIFNRTVPSLSCGSHPGLVHNTVKNFGTYLMLNVGGAIHGHPMGSEAGARAMRQAIECEQLGENIYDYMQKNPELKQAINKWGYIE